MQEQRIKDSWADEQRERRSPTFRARTPGCYTPLHSTVCITPNPQSSHLVAMRIPPQTHTEEPSQSIPNLMLQGLLLAE